MPKKKITAKDVALALAKASISAGQAFGAHEQQSVEERAENMLRVGPHGAYVSDKDPGGWAPSAPVIIYMETKGGEGDCYKPLDYYGDGFEVAFKASELMDGYYIEFINAAVAAVYPC